MTTRFEISVVTWGGFEGFQFGSFAKKICQNNWNLYL